MKEYYINEKLAEHAHNINSMRDYQPNKATNEYRSYLNDFEERVKELMEKHPENVNDPTMELVEYYKDKYAQKLAVAINKSNSIEAMMPSVMIAGPANFNTRKKERQNNARDNFWDQYGSLFSEDNYYYKKIYNLLTNKVIYSNDEFAEVKLTNKIADLEEWQQRMKDINAYYRKNKTLDGCDLIASDKELKDLQWHLSYPPHVPCPSYSLTNNLANIKRLKERLASLQKMKERDSQNDQNKYPQVDGLTVKEDADDMRIRIIFNAIPDQETRTLLKQHGFKWSPTNSAWQRQLTPNGIRATQNILNQLKGNNNNE